MAKILISGGVPLHGEVQISGAKNAVLPILTAGLLAGFAGPDLAALAVIAATVVAWDAVAGTAESTPVRARRTLAVLALPVLLFYRLERSHSLQVEEPDYLVVLNSFLWWINLGWYCWSCS